MTVGKLVLVFAQLVAALIAIDRRSVQRRAPRRALGRLLRREQRDCPLKYAGHHGTQPIERRNRRACSRRSIAASTSLPARSTCARCRALKSAPVSASGTTKRVGT